MPERAAEDRRRPGSKAVLLAAVALASAAALVSATQTWVVVALADGAAAFDGLEISGQHLNSSLSPVAIAALASVLALTIAGPAFRRVLGILVGLFGAGIITLGIFALVDPRAESESAVGEATGILGAGQDELVQSVAVTPWPSVAVAAGVALAIAGVCILVLGGRWRSGGRRYVPTSHTGQGAGTTGPHEPDRISDWDAMSEGEDPTGEDATGKDPTSAG